MRQPDSDAGAQVTCHRACGGCLLDPVHGKVPRGKRPYSPAMVSVRDGHDGRLRFGATGIVSRLTLGWCIQPPTSSLRSGLKPISRPDGGCTIAAMNDGSISCSPLSNGLGALALPSLENCRVLVVDDEADSRRVLARHLTRAGAQVREADSVAAAFDVLGSWTADVLVSDIAMPGEDGYSLARRLRASAQESLRDLPAVALTAFVRCGGSGAGARGRLPAPSPEAVRTPGATARSSRFGGPYGNRQAHALSARVGCLARTRTLTK